jgi:signal transduction histidine kinase
MRERSESLGGRLQVWSDGNAGTEIELRIPAEIAYLEAPESTVQRIKCRLIGLRPWRVRR